MLPYSGDNRCPLPPEPPLRVAFSSSLSPSAVPFPADPAGPGRDLPTAPSVYAAGGEWGSASWMEPPVSYMAPVSSAAAASPGYNGEDSHYAPYGIYSGNRFSNFAGLHSFGSESSNSISDKHPRSCQESSEALSSGFGASVFHQQQNAFVSKLLDHSGAEDTGPYPPPPRQDLNQYPFGSAYDKYMTQLSSCSTDTQPHILSTQFVDSSEMAKITDPVTNHTTGENSFSFSSYMNPCRINLDYFDCVWNEQKDLGYQTIDKQHGNWRNSLGDKATVRNYPLNSLGESHLTAKPFGNVRHMQESSEVKHDVGSFNSKASSAEVGLIKPHEFSSELLEVNNTTVDSPCWKGTPATYQPSFGIMENNDAPRLVIGTVGYNSSHQNQKAPELSSGYPGRFLGHQEASGSENDIWKTFKLPSRCIDSKDHREVPPVNVKVHDMASHVGYLPGKTQKCYESEEDSKNVITSSQQKSSCLASKPTLSGDPCGSHTAGITEVISKEGLSPISVTPGVQVDDLTREIPHGNSSYQAAEKEENIQKRGEEPSQCYPGAEGNVLKMSCDSSSSTRAIFLKLMHNLSVVLLSTCKDGSSLQEDEEELLHSVIQNLTSASSKRSKVEQIADDGLGNSGHKFKNMSDSRMGMHGHSTSNNADLDFKTTVSQVLTKPPEDKMLDDTDVSQASVYKKLWIEAEASACKLKYELQLSRLKLATMKGHSNTTKVPDSSEGSKGSNSPISSSKQTNRGKESVTCAAAFHCQGKDSGIRQSPVVNRNIVNGVDADVFARLQVLQSRMDNVMSFVETDRKEQQDASQKSYEAEDAVMARLNVSMSRPDNITLLSQESLKHQLDASTNRADDVDDAVLARMRIFEPHSNNVTFLVQESNKQQFDAIPNREDGVDGAIMARLRILKSRPDNITSMGDISEEDEDGCNVNGDEVGIMDGGGITNIRGGGKVFNSYAFADRLERKGSVGGLDFADGTCVTENSRTGSSANVSTLNRCEAPCDEVSNKGTVVGENNLGENQAPGDSQVRTEGSQEVHLSSSPVHQHDSSPSEWEHVLKENFFHPGK